MSSAGFGARVGTREASGSDAIAFGLGDAPIVPPVRGRQAAAIIAILLAAVALVGVLFLFVLPGRAYLAQRRTLTAGDFAYVPSGMVHAYRNEETSKILGVGTNEH